MNQRIAWANMLLAILLLTADSRTVSAQPQPISRLVLPPQGARPFPVVVVIGGGKEFDVLAQHGLAVAHTNGGIASDFNRGYRSAKATVRWLSANGRSVNLDPDRIATIGISKNGNAATGVALSRGLGAITFGERVEIAPGGRDDPAERVRCAVNLCGTTDLMQTDRFGGTKTGGPMNMTIAVAMANSAINYVSRDDPPVLLLFPFGGGAHGWVSGHRFDAAYRRAGLQSTLLLAGMRNWEALAVDFFAMHLQDRKSPTRVHVIAGGNASQGGPCCGWFTVVRFGDLSKELAVKYSAAGGKVCKPLSGTVTIAAGQTSAEIVVHPLATGTVTVDLVADQAYELGANRQAKIGVVSGVVPGVYAVCTRPYAKPPQGRGLITVARWGSTTQALAVNYSVLGNAVAGTDYRPLPGKITLAAGQRSATIEVVPLKYPRRGETYKSVALSLDRGEGYEFGPYCGAACVVLTDEAAPDTPEIGDPFGVR
ncbi:MAG TPA: hypothetical protein VNE39_12830 [Planctomycetota bacterium]|nr:hypothetical protein [Planctomycetota bacterium]